MSNKSEKERSDGVARANASYLSLMARKTRLTVDQVHHNFNSGWTFKEYYNQPDVWVSPEGRQFTVSEMVDMLELAKPLEEPMADNLKGIPFSSADEGFSYPSLAKEIVLDMARALMPPSVREGFTTNDVYVVWFAYVLGYWKAICSTNIADGRMYEVTFNREKSMAYVDTYMKTHNIEVHITNKKDNS